MAFYDKVFKFDRQENFDSFVNSINDGKLTEDFKQALINYKPTVKIVKDGDTYTLTTSRPGGEVVISFKDGVEFDEKIGENTAKSTITVNGNTFEQTQKFPEGTIKMKREFTDNELVVTYSTSQWNGPAKRYFKA